MAQSRRVGHPLAFALVGCAFAITMLGTTLPTPLYPLYQQRIGFSAFVTTIVFAVYAAGVIGALLFVGRMSDEVGRKPVLLAGLAFSALSAAAFLVAGGLPWLFLGRVLSGLSAGIFTGTATATLVDLAPGRTGLATLVATLANAGGLGSGPLLAGLLAKYGPMPLRLCFIVDLVLLAVALGGLLVVPETVAVRARTRLRMQRLVLPEGDGRGLFIRAAAAGFAGFAVLGLFTAVAPAFLGKVLDRPDHALTGVVVFAVFLASLLGQLALSRFPGGSALPIGCLVLVVGMGLIVVSLEARSLGLLIAGGVVAGIGQGLSFRAGLASVNAVAAPEQRAAVASSFFVLCYVAVSIPVVGVGLLAELTSLVTAGVTFSVLVALLALGTGVSLLQRARQD